MKTEEVFLTWKIGNFIYMCPIKERFYHNPIGNYHKGYYLKKKRFYTKTCKEYLGDDDEEDDYAESFLMKEEMKYCSYP